jgi:drug/metabolite transporter (DMT)-like permease
MSSEPPHSLRSLPTGAHAVLNNPALRGMALMFLGTFFVAAMIGSIRYVSATLHPFEIALFRNVFALVVVLPWFYRYGIAPLRTQHFGLHGLRALFNIIAMLCFFYAVSIAPLSEVTALGFTSPIFATVLAALVLGEIVHARRWVSIAVGFLGAMIILRPGFAAVGLGQMLALFSAMAWSCALMVIKTLGRTDSSATIISYMGLLMVPLSLVPALFVWQWPDLYMWGWLIAIGVLGGLGQFCVTEALRQADTAVVMPIDFFKLVWVTVIAYLAFSEHLDLYTWIGGAVIFASAVSLVYRDRAGEKRARPA